MADGVQHQSVVERLHLVRRRDDPAASEMRLHEPQLVAVDVLVACAGSRGTQIGDEPAAADVGDGGRATVTDDDVGAGDLRLQLGMVEQSGPRPIDRGTGRPVLDEDVVLGVATGELVRPGRPGAGRGGGRCRRSPGCGSQQRPHEDRARVEVALLLPLHAEERAERTAEPTGDRSAVDAVVDLDVDGRDALGAAEQEERVRRRRRRCDTITSGRCSAITFLASAVFRARFGRLRVVG